MSVVSWPLVNLWPGNRIYFHTTRRLFMNPSVDITGVCVWCHLKWYGPQQTWYICRDDSFRAIWKKQIAPLFSRHEYSCRFWRYVTINGPVPGKRIVHSGTTIITLIVISGKKGAGLLEWMGKTPSIGFFFTAGKNNAAVCLFGISGYCHLTTAL